MKTAKDFNTDGERLEYVKGILEATQKNIKGFREEYSSGYMTHNELEEMIELEKAGTYNLIEEFFEED